MNNITFQGVIVGLKSAYDIAIGMSKLNTLSQVQAKSVELGQIIIETQTAVFKAHAAQSAMIEQIRKLKEEIIHIKAWKTQKKRYKLVIPWPQHAVGSVAYALKESMKESEPPHLICTKCYEDGRKSILNPFQPTDGRMVYTCPVCKLKIPTGSKWIAPAVQYVSG